MDLLMDPTASPLNLMERWREAVAACEIPYPASADSLTKAEKHRQKTIFWMHLLAGSGPTSQTCEGCAHLITRQYHDGKYFKCDAYLEAKRSISGMGSAATDWRKSWPSCGRFQPK